MISIINQPTIRKLQKVVTTISNLYSKINILMIQIKRYSSDMSYIVTIYLKYLNVYSYRVLTDSSVSTSRLLRLIYRKFNDLPLKDYFTYDVHYA